MIYCHSCDKDYSHKFIMKHYTSERHLKKAFEIKHIEKHKQILLEDIVNVFANLFERHIRKFKYFLLYAKLLIENI